MSKVIWKVIGAIIVLALVLWGLGLVLGWGKTAVDIVSPENVKAQNQTVINKFNGMIAASKNACTVQKSGTAGGERSALLIEDPVMAYSATFNNIVAEYNDAVDNIFRAGLVGPVGYPRSVDINSIDTSDWCTVPKQVLALRD